MASKLVVHLDGDKRTLIYLMSNGSGQKTRAIASNVDKDDVPETLKRLEQECRDALPSNLF